MDKLRKDWLASLDPRKTNALAMAAALVDDDAPDTKPKEESKEAAKETAPERPPSEQIPMLVQALLSIGSIPLAQSFLARYPWLAQSHPAITDMILLIVSRALEPAYQTCYRLDTIDDDFVWDAPGPSHMAPEGLPIIVSLWNPPPVATPSHAIDFFYPDWDEQLEEWHSLDEVFEKSYRWLGLVRGATARSPDTCVKLCRMATAYFEGFQKEKEALNPVQGVRTSRQLRAIQVSSGEPADRLTRSPLRRKCRRGYPSSAKYSFLRSHVLPTSLPSVPNYGHCSSTFPIKPALPCTATGETPASQNHAIQTL